MACFFLQRMNTVKYAYGKYVKKVIYASWVRIPPRIRLVLTAGKKRVVSFSLTWGDRRSVLVSTNWPWRASGEARCLAARYKGNSYLFLEMCKQLACPRSGMVS